MKQTSHFKLNQYEAADRIQHTDFNSDNQKIDAAIAAAVPSGTICLWSGAVTSIPAGWTLCNGSSGTPDLRGRFLIGAGGDYNVGSTGGAASEALKQYNYTGGSLTGYFRAYEGDLSVHDNRPPYYALCYIMKL